MDIFERIRKDEGGPLGQYRRKAHGYYMFPKLEGPIEPYMTFQGKQVLAWTFNNYLGLANHPDVRKADAEAAAKWGLAYPMGARMMSGHTSLHERLERELADFEKKEDAYLFNFGYQGMVSTIDALLNRRDVVVYDSQAHACIMDGMRLHMGQRIVYPHNDLEKCDKALERATRLTEKSGGGILLITEGVYGMTGALGFLDKIVSLKKKYNFRILIDDAHGFGVMGKNGRGTSEHFNVMDEVDLYFGAFAKAMAGIGGFVAGPAEIINYLRYNLRSQIYAKSLPMPMVEGLLKRLDMIRTMPELREKLWLITTKLQEGLKKNGFDIGPAEACVTPVFLKGELTEATNILIDLRENYRIFCSVVVYPVVPRDVIMYRLIPTAMHSLEHVTYTLNAFSKIQEKLQKGLYKGNEIKNMAIK
ncbi:MAG: aminotransferase class I/II-fold pyridoxal phosphate-dependent enzyme [Bacteroidales bacterium]|jgi:glycine C-acetyltransferase|nr:aminotransferase class I/II-fold pyridoxal phosphate-dependent enzyme [Bacteroidales bacterium]MBP9000233.1 aminotransferase class I/II-fold pyridoxal phosphate-dependent enzyme [Bacteroidales bacterium]MBV6456313.1 4-hydroxy-2,2'-bipyrrole-5-methanol synthase PigH [Bacteroidales bacterium]NLZ08772.1 aminotransferase class I/II-fold pyridoxal phosphate-dependent enzyme [Bacteroidales bacterium]OQC58087.1 MAG: 2-amino-3-ketobutyrate coenzyme A ligase [Bacteroidetes bacterium ADurb.Bin013]